MKVSTPKPLQYLVKVSSVSKEFVQELEADEFKFLLRNYWEDGKRHRLEGNRQMAYICWMSFFLTLFNVQAYRKDICHLTCPGSAAMALLSDRLDEILILSRELVEQESYRFEHEPKAHTNIYLYQMHPECPIRDW